MIDLNSSRNLAVRRRAGCFQVHFVLPVLVTRFGLMMLAGRLTAQTFTTLYSFSLLSGFPYSGTNSDGGYPIAGLILAGNTLYGTASQGDRWGNGTLFKLSTNGTGFTKLHSFSGGSDGADPNGLILTGNTLFGTAYGNGNPGYGTVFAVNTDGSGFTSLYGLDGGSDGGEADGLVLSGNTLYGAAAGGA